MAGWLLLIAAAAVQEQPPPKPVVAEARVRRATIAELVAGLPVHDRTGAAIGTLASVDGARAVVAIGTVAVVLPVEAFGRSATGLVLLLGDAERDALLAAAR